MIRFRPSLYLLALLLVGCDVFSDSDPLVSTYDFTATDDNISTNPVLTQGEIGLTLIPSDVSSIPDGWRGTWNLDPRGEPNQTRGEIGGHGSISGFTQEDGTVRLEFFVDRNRLSASIGYVLTGQFEDDGERFVGSWETRGGFTGGTLFTGAFDARLTRRATEFIIAG